MAGQNIDPEQVVLRLLNKRCAYVHLAQPNAFRGGQPKYSITVMIPKTAPTREACANFLEVKNRLDQISMALVGKPADEGMFYGTMAIFKDGDAIGQDWCRGQWTLKLSQRADFTRPKVFDANGQPMKPEDGYMLPEGVPIGSGHWYNVVAEGFSVQNGAKISLALVAVQHLRVDEAIAGGGGPKIDTTDANVLFGGAGQQPMAAMPQNLQTPQVPSQPQTQPMAASAGVAPAMQPAQPAGVQVQPPVQAPPVAQPMPPAPGIPQPVTPAAPAGMAPVPGQPPAVPAQPEQPAAPAVPVQPPVFGR